MKKRYILLLSLCLLTSPALAEDSGQTQNQGLLNSLHANHSLLAQYQNEYMTLKEKQGSPTEADARKIKDLEDKIKALEEDSQELQSFLPMDHQAEAFVTDLMSKKARGEKIKQLHSAGNLLQETELKHALPATSAAAENAFRMHERALKLVSDGHFKEAVQLYEEIVMKNPDDDEAYLIMGHTYLLMGQYQKAERAFQNAVHIDPENIHEITPFYENTVLQNPDSDSGYANLGYALLIIGDVVKAKNAFLESLRINPENASAQNGLMYLERLMIGQ